jgi:signal transduction histidine kinase
MWAPLDARRAWLTGGWLVAAVTVLVAVDVTVRGVGLSPWWLLLLLFAAAGAWALAATDLGFVRGRAGMFLLYASAVLGAVAVVAFAMATGEVLVRVAPVLALGTVASGSAFPRAGLAFTTALLAVAGLAVGLLVGPGGLPEVLVVVSGLLLLGWLVDALAGHLRRSTQAELAARAAAERTSRVLATVGRAATLDRRAALLAVVDGVRELGGSAASIELVRGGVRTPVVARGCSPEPVRADAGIAGRALQADELVTGSVGDAAPAGWDVEHQAAVPVRVEGVPAGVLVAGWHGPTSPPELLDLLPHLAEHAAGAMVAARQLADEQEVVRRLRQLDAMERSFVTSISHELRTPLSVVQGFADTLLARRDELPPVAVADMVDRLSSNASRLGAMLGGLLDFNRFGAGDLHVTPQTLDLSLLVRTVLVRLEPVLATHRLVVDLTPDAEVMADGAMLEHVVENLVGNALKHTPAGTTVTVSVRPDPEAGMIELAVADDGPGVPPSELPLLGEAGFRGSRTSEQRIEGAGLGLDLVSRILRAHDSSLHVVSTLGVGTTFSFRLRGPEQQAGR